MAVEAATPVAAARRRSGEGVLSLGGRGWLAMILVMGTATALFVAWRLYQQEFAWTVGLDATSAGFARYWKSMLYLNAVGIFGGGVVWWLTLARTRCRTCDAQVAAAGTVDAVHEEAHIRRLWALTTAVSLGFFLAAWFGEQDAAWHQTAVRDTAFTPSHIILFWASFPIVIVFSIGSLLYARTRLPKMYGPERGFPASFLFLISAPLLLQAWVAVNEWAHSLFQTEEIFSAPLHWGFVVTAYFGAGLFAVWFELIERVIDLRIGPAATEPAEPPPRIPA